MFYTRLKKICQKKGTTITGMLKELNLSTGSTGNWKKGQLPKGEVLVLIADYLDTSIDYLIQGEYKSDLSEDEKRIIELYRNTPERAKYKVMCDVEKIVQEEIDRFEAEHY